MEENPERKLLSVNKLDIEFDKYVKQSHVSFYSKRGHVCGFLSSIHTKLFSEYCFSDEDIIELSHFREFFCNAFPEIKFSRLFNAVFHIHGKVRPKPVPVENFLKSLPPYSEKSKDLIKMYEKYLLLRKSKLHMVKRSYTYRVLLNEFSDLTIPINCENSVGENLLKESMGEYVKILFRRISTSKHIEPEYYELASSSIEELSARDKRELFRQSTVHLYKKVYASNNYRCLKCNAKANVIHHVKYEVKEETEEEYMKTMMPLCDPCHTMETKEQLKARKFDEIKSKHKSLSDF